VASLAADGAAIAFKNMSLSKSNILQALFTEITDAAISLRLLGNDPTGTPYKLGSTLFTKGA